MKSITQTVKEKIVMLLQPEFEFDIKDRILVVSDLDHYSAKEDVFVNAQKKGKLPTFYEVYWDNEWIMDFHEGDTPRAVFTQFLKGFHDAYVQGKVRLNPLLADAEKQYDLDAMIKNQRVEAMKDLVSGAFEVGGSDDHKPSQAEEETSRQIIKEIEEESK